MKTPPAFYLNRRTEYFSEIFGYRLEAGDVLEPEDVYDSSNGRWERCPCPGLVVGEGVDTVWIRPVRADT